MKILYISTVFPRPNQNSTIYTDLAEELRDRGHDITVVASDGSCEIKETQIVSERGIRVLRVKTIPMYNVGFIKKGIAVITLKSYLIKGMKRVLGKEKFDLILFEAPPVTISGVVKWAMKKYECPSYLMLKDIFPQNAVDLDILKKSGIIYKYFKYKEKQLYRVASKIGCMSEANKRYILTYNKEVNDDKVEIFPNTKKIREDKNRNSSLSMRYKYDIPINDIVAVLGGNMGKPQGIEFLMECVNSCRDINGLYFLFVGRGTERNKVQSYIENNNLRNVKLLHELPREDYEELLKSCDIGIISLNSKFTIPNYPSRVLSYFEYKMPVLAITDKNNDFGEMIEKVEAGYWVNSNDSSEVKRKISDLSKSIELREGMGQKGYDYMINNFNVGISADILEKFTKV